MTTILYNTINYNRLKYTIKLKKDIFIILTKRIIINFCLNEQIQFYF